MKKLRVLVDIKDIVDTPLIRWPSRASERCRKALSFEGGLFGGPLMPTLTPRAICSESINVLSSFVAGTFRRVNAYQEDR